MSTACGCRDLLDFALRVEPTAESPLQRQRMSHRCMLRRSRTPLGGKARLMVEDPNVVATPRPKLRAAVPYLIPG